MSREETLMVCNALNFEAHHFDALVDKAYDKGSTPAQTIEVWRQSAATRRALTRKLLGAEADT